MNLKMHNLIIDDYYRLLISQKRRCAWCNGMLYYFITPIRPGHSVGSRPILEHDHRHCFKCGKNQKYSYKGGSYHGGSCGDSIRGLVHGHCNQEIRIYDHNIEKFHDHIRIMDRIKSLNHMNMDYFSNPYYKKLHECPIG